MKFPLLQIILTILLLTSYSPLFAQECRNLSLNECIDYALKNNTEIKIIESETRQSQAKTEEISSARNFRAGLNTSLTYQEPEVKVEIPMPGRPVSITAVPNWNYSTGLSVSKILTTFGKLEETIKVSKHNVNILNAKASLKKNTAVLNAVNGYYAVLSAQEMLKKAEKADRTWEEHYREAQVLFRHGVIARYDLLKINTTLSRTKKNITSARKNLEISQGNLKNILSIDPKECILVIPDEFFSDEHPKEDYIESAVRNNPSVLLGELILKQNIMMRDLAQIEDKPALTFQTSYSRQTATLAAKDWAWKNTVNLNYPLFDGGEKKAKVAQANEGITQARLNLDETKKNIAWEAEKAYIALEELKAAYEADTNQLLTAKEGARVALIRYKNGLGTLAELTDSELGLSDSETAIAQTSYRIKMQKALLLYIAGNLYTEITGECR